MAPLPGIATALLLLNLWTIMRFWQDKQRAIAGERRVAEADLLGPQFPGAGRGPVLPPMPLDSGLRRGTG